MAGELARPASSEELYIARGDPAEPWRPIMTGDVFRGPQIPGLEEHPMLMVITHPCTMRGKSGLLKPRLQALPVVAYQDVPLKSWPTQHFRVLPLPDLAEGEQGHAARLDEFGVLNSDDLTLDTRVACLSETGIKILLQRFFHCFARVNVSLQTISIELASPLQEAELLEEWNEEIAAARVEQGESLDDSLEDEAKKFDILLSAESITGKPLRTGLGEATEAVSVRRAVRAEIDKRLE